MTQYMASRLPLPSLPAMVCRLEAQAATSLLVFMADVTYLLSKEMPFTVVGSSPYGSSLFTSSSSVSSIRFLLLSSTPADRSDSAPPIASVLTRTTISILVLGRVLWKKFFLPKILASSSLFAPLELGAASSFAPVFDITAQMSLFFPVVAIAAWDLPPPPSTICVYLSPPPFVI